MSDNPSTGENAAPPPASITPTAASHTVPVYNPPRQRSAPPIVGGEASEMAQGSIPPPRGASVPGYPSPMPYAAGYGAAPPGGTYGQAMFPPPLGPALYSPHTYQGSSAYPPQAHMPTYVGPPPTGYPHPASHPVYPQQYHPAQMAGSPQLVYSGYAKPMPANPSYPPSYPPGANPPQPFNVVHPQTAGGSKYLPAFQESNQRQGFVRKVLCLVLIQLVVTTAAGAAALSVDSLQEYLMENLWVFWASMVGAMILVIVGTCNYSMLGHHPMNLLFLSSFTALCSVMVAALVGRYDSQAVLLSFIVATGLVFALVLMASRGNFDITNWGGMLFAFLLVLMVTSIVGVFWVNSIFIIVFSGIGAVLFSIYLVYDVQMIMMDKKRGLAPDEYIMGAITIYLDIVNIFLYLLSLLGLARSRNARE